MNFAEKVYEQLRKVPRGKVTTYKLLAEAVGTKAYRAVGQALRNNPYAPEVPCHRVVASDGTLGGFMGQHEGEKLERKKALLKREGVEIKNNRVVDFQNVLFQIPKGT
jgi:methylated-DNA-[protein]-cysteine S-methyltransferase